MLWQISTNTQVWFPLQSGVLTRKAVSLNFWAEVSLKKTTMSLWFYVCVHPLELLLVLLRCNKYWGCLCASLVAGLVVLLLFEIIKKDFIEEAASRFSFKPRGHWWTFTSLEASGFPLWWTKRWFIQNLSTWLCVLAYPCIDYMAVGNKVEINSLRRTDIRYYIEDTFSIPISGSRISPVPQLPTQK